MAIFSPGFLKKALKHAVAGDSIGEGFNIRHVTVPHQGWYNPLYLKEATYKILQKNIRKAGFSVTSANYEKIDYKMDNSNRKITSGHVDFIMKIMTPDGQDRSVNASVVIENDIICDTVDHFTDNCGNKYAFTRAGLKSFLMGVEEETNKPHETVYPSVGDGGSQSGQAGGAEPNLAFMQKDLKIMKLGHAKDSRITEAMNKIAATNEQVIELFINDSFPKDKMTSWGTPNLKITKQSNGWALVNYSTPLLYRDADGMVYFNTQKYSVSTSRIQNLIRSILGGKEPVEVDESGIKEKIGASK